MYCTYIHPLIRSRTIFKHFNRIRIFFSLFLACAFLRNCNARLIITSAIFMASIEKLFVLMRNSGYPSLVPMNSLSSACPGLTEDLALFDHSLTVSLSLLSGPCW